MSNIKKQPDPLLIDSMAMRYRHDFGLLTLEEQQSIRVIMTQLWEEVVGLGFYKSKHKQMSNNKQSMELYTERQMREMFRMGLAHSINEDGALYQFAPIELPSDEEIDVHVEDDFLNASEVHKYSEEAQLLMKAMCKAGALWMRDKIQGGSK